MKKIIASVLAAASVLSLSAVAFAADANDKAVTKPGELTYEVTATSPKIVLDLVMPAKMTAQLNPYGAEIKIDASDADKVSINGILSVEYKITNNSADYGVYLDATAITTVTTTDKTKWEVKAAAPVDGTKSAQLALLTGVKPTITSKNITVPAANVAMTDASKTQGVLVMNSTVTADKTKGIAAGQTSQKKVCFVKAKDGSTAGEAYMTFVGALAGSKSDGTADVVWNEDDAINVNLVLKVIAGPKTAPAAPAAP